MVQSDTEATSNRQRYQIVKKLDMGGMAEIFLGRAQSIEGIERQVAIKRVLPSLTRNEQFMAMFLDEARLSMQLTHANIVQVFDVGRASGTVFIVMEYIDGIDVAQLPAKQQCELRQKHWGRPFANLVHDFCKSGINRLHLFERKRRASALFTGHLNCLRLSVQVRCEAPAP